ncbi:MAG: porphobilinogen synthase [Gammaproteobacteria bacterium]|nr:porphobilinogen synthase [Gammaproteobacteria bacterium]
MGGVDRSPDHGLNRRRGRLHRGIRELTQRIYPAVPQFIQPLFVTDADAREAIPGLTDVWRDTPATLITQVRADLEQGISKFLLFDIPPDKHDQDFDHDFACEQIRALKQSFGDDIWLAVDVCLCSSTTHGHCGILNEDGSAVLNEPSVRALADAALSFAAAGADCVAPSDMMDGRVAAIRAALDADGLESVAIMSYSAKFHSGFYGPFRLAADSAPAEAAALQDRATYQIDPARSDDALQCSLRDAGEGADILMVKPGMPYLDVLAKLSDAIPLPWAVYQTSGEAAGFNLLDEHGIGNRARLNREAWTAFLRAGASMIISYDARHARAWLS